MRKKILFFTLGHMAFAPQAFAQAPAASTPKFLGTTADIKALVDANKRGNIVQIGPYKANLEIRDSVGVPSIHDKDNELFYIIDGSVDVLTGGTLVGAKHNDPLNQTGTSIEGGSTVRLNKGDFYIVPANTPHQLTPIGGKLLDMSLHLPIAVPAQ